MRSRLALRLDSDSDVTVEVTWAWSSQTGVLVQNVTSQGDDLPLTRPQLRRVALFLEALL